VPRPYPTFEAVDPTGAVHTLGHAKVACYNHRTRQALILPDGLPYQPLRDLSEEFPGFCRLGIHSVNPQAVCWIRHKDFGQILAHHENWLNRYDASIPSELAHLVEAAHLHQITELGWMSLSKATSWTGKSLRMLNSIKTAKGDWRAKIHSWIVRRWARAEDGLWINPAQARLLRGGTFPYVTLDRSPQIPLANLPEAHRVKIASLPWVEIFPEIRINLNWVCSVRVPDQGKPWVDLGMGVIVGLGDESLARVQQAVEKRDDARAMAGA
jgi:hypothetical protein